MHLLIGKPPQLPYSKVNVALNVAVIRDLNVKFVAAKVVVIVGPCYLEAHFAGFWHALQLFNRQGIQEVQLESHLSIANLPLLLLTWIKYCQLAVAAFNMDSSLPTPPKKVT